MSAPIGPASLAIEAALHEEVRRGSIVLWLDRHALYGDLAQTLAEREQAPYRTLRWQGSHLELLLALEEDTRGQRKPRVVIHLPGFTEEQVQESPLLELWQAGHRFRISLESAVQAAALGRLPREDIQAFLDTKPESLPQVEAWLNDALAQGPDLSRVLQDLPLPALAQQLLSQDPSQEPQDQLWEAVRIRVGLDKMQWLSEVVGLRKGETPGPDEVGYALGSWALCVEFVHDLHPDARAKLEGVLQEPADLSKPLVDDCRAVCQALRSQIPERYARIAAEVQELVAPLLTSVPADQLGDIDTFPQEAVLVLEAACRRLRNDDHRWPAQVAARRLKPGGSFWVAQQPIHQAAWELVQATAKLVAALTTCPPLPPFKDLAHATDYYVRHGAAVDRAHRELEQLAEQHLAKLDQMSPQVQTTLVHARDIWHDWAQKAAEAFGDLCQATGYLPGSELQQRQIFDQHVAPWSDARHPVAYFMVDALRFEMAQALAQEIDADAKGRTDIKLEPRLAELPTNTSVGMNALAPVSRAGKLEALVKGKSVDGFHAGARQVRTPKDRQAAMQDRVGGKVPRIELRELVGKTPEALKRWRSGAQVLMVTCGEIDHSGEHGAGPHVFESALQLVLAGWRRLRQVGVKRFVITADHGFLLQHEPEKQAYGKKIAVGRRGKVQPAAPEPLMQGVRLGDLGYTGPDVGQFLVMPKGLQILDRGNRFEGFAHGGNSLQERVIPVLRIEHRSKAGRNLARYTLDATLEPHSQGWALRGRLRPEGLTLGFAGVSDVALDLEFAGSFKLSPQHQCHLDGERVRVDVGQDFVLVGQGARQGTLALSVRHTAAEIEMDAVSYTVDLTPPQVDPLASVSSPLKPAFKHLLEHRLVTEGDLFNILGSARLSRRFARTVQSWAQEQGYTLTVSNADGTRYEIDK